MSLVKTLRLTLCLAAALLAVAAARANPPAPEHHGWWSWSDGIFGFFFDGVSYGDGPGGVVGSDKLVRDVRAIGGAHAIELRGPINIVLKQGTADKATVHTDDNIAPFVQTTVTDGVLHIGMRPGAHFRARHPIGVTVELNRLDALKVIGSGGASCAQFETDLLELTVVGSGEVRFDSLKAGAVAVLIQGSGTVTLAGAAAQQGYVIEGSGDVDADDLTGRDVAVRVAGSGDAKVWATANLTVEIAGSGDVRYHGNPALKKAIHGSGDASRE